ncbi:MAG: ferredoxin [Thermoprotei archaeon]|nr:MAG: ferredoxin [Thermoprotei archaeon]
MVDYYKVKIDWKKCIGCMSCVAVCPEVFDIDENEQRAIIKERYRRTLQDFTTGMVPSSIMECIKDAVEICPTSAITMVGSKEE